MTIYIILGILVALLVTLLYIIYNLLSKVEKYEDITLDQTKYLQSISNIISQSQVKLQELDQKGHFQADDELGEFFDQMKAVQALLNKYMLPENYGESKIEG